METYRKVDSRDMGTKTTHKNADLSGITWCDVNPLSTLADIAHVLSPVITADFDITDINGGNAG